MTGQDSEDLRGKVAIVAGGGRDIGLACAQRLARSGAAVCIHYRHSEDSARQAAEQINAEGGRAIAVGGDLTDVTDIKNLVHATLDAFGNEIHILVHATGGLIARKKLTEMEISHWHRVVDLNTTSLIQLVQTSLPYLSSGSVVALSSQAARDGGGPGAVAYAAAKGAVSTLVRGLAKELSPSIRVNAVCPGMIDTDFHNTFTLPEVRKKVAEQTPMRREGRSEDVANLVKFLVSDEAAFMTGTNIDINGGLLFS